MELMFIVYGILVFYFGMVVGFLLHWWLVKASSGGVIVVTKESGKTVYSLVLDDYPEKLEFKKRVMFRIDAPNGLDRE
jgi:hypothetical protein